MRADVLLQTSLPAEAQEVRTPEPVRLDVVLGEADLLNSVNALVASKWGYLAAISGLDPASPADLEVLYHFCSGPYVVTLRVRTPRTTASVPSVCALIPSASVFERELSELFGITFTGAPDTSRLLLPAPRACRATSARRHPYVAYAQFPVTLSLRRTGDLEARVLVRLLELFESYRVIHVLLDDMPAGPLAARMLAGSRPVKRSVASRPARRAVVFHQEQRHRQT